ncbi:MAG: polymer-forming cytoskeletal protein [Acidobacteriia bacterium]|nr:polymer-forming cytoskeletal protein [Terriglobia bacterium]
MPTILDCETEPVATGAIRNFVPTAATHAKISVETSLVGCTVRIEGRIFCDQDLFVDGEVKGSIELPDHTLTIGAHAKVTASIQAHSVVIIGQSQGDIQASGRVELRSLARHEGDIRTSRIAIQDGAYFKGTIEVTRPASTPSGGTSEG